MIENWDIVVVSYNSEADLRRCWLSQPPEILRRVIQVDNSSTDESRRVLAGLSQKLIRSPNRGLASSNNRGAAAGSAPFVLFCNPDVCANGTDLATIEHALDVEPGLVSPRLADPSGELQDNARGWPVLADQIQNRLGVRRVRQEEDASAEADRYGWPAPAGERARVPWLVGAAVAVRREDFCRVGGWPEDYFLYYEDVELCLRFWEAGLSVRVLGDLIWMHRWRRESRKLLGAASRMHLRSALHFFSSRPTLLIGYGGERYARLMDRG